MSDQSEPRPARPPVVVIGDVMTDVVVRLGGPVAPGSDTPSSIRTHPGGSGANLAAWLAGAGLEVHFVGCVGADPFAVQHRAALERAGVTPHLAVAAGRDTGALVSLVAPDGERSMLSDRGANLGLRPEHLPGEVFHPGAWLHLSGYTLLAPETRPAGLAALALARGRGMGVSVDPASVALLEAAGPDHFIEWTDGADLCFPNLDEGRLLSGADEPDAILAALCPHYRGVALKLGAAGAACAHDGGGPIYVPAEAVAAVDTTGAGDAFCAGFLASWLRSGSVADALAEGVRFGALAAGRVGARPPRAGFGG